VNDPQDHTSASGASLGEEPTVMGLLARRVDMTEGQLYTTIIVVLAVALLTLTGMPGAGRADDATPFPSGTASSGEVAP
jgi:hypothetical protein